MGHSAWYASFVVYFVQMGQDGPVKIGYSRDEAALKARMRSIDYGLPYPARLLGTLRRAGRQVEHTLHVSFARHRLRGEWFRPHPDILQAARSASQGIQFNGERRDRRPLEAADRAYRKVVRSSHAD